MDFNLGEEEKLVDFQRLLELGPKLNQEVQQSIASDRPMWRNPMGHEKIIVHCKENQRASYGDKILEFRERLYLYQLSLEESRKACRLWNEINILCSITSFSFFAAWRLKPLALDVSFRTLDPADIAFQKFHRGWKALSGWDKVNKLFNPSKGAETSDIILRYRCLPPVFGPFRQQRYLVSNSRGKIDWTWVAHEDKS